MRLQTTPTMFYGEETVGCRENYMKYLNIVCVCVWQNGKFLKFSACGTNTGALNGYVAKPVNLSVHDPYELSS